MPSPNYTLQPATIEDDDLLRSIFTSACDPVFELAPWPAEIKKALLQQQFEAQRSAYRSKFPNGCFELIRFDDDIVGRLYMDRGPEIHTLVDITLLAPFRSRGLGSRIIRDLLDEARSVSKPVSLHVEHQNPEALRLYQRLGFIAVADTATHRKMRWDPAQ